MSFSKLQTMEENSILTELNSLIVRGVDKINPNKNVHFINVKTLYFFVKGLIMTLDTLQMQMHLKETENFLLEY